MKKKTQKAARPKSLSAARGAARRPRAVETTPEEVAHLEALSQRIEESERAWARMTAAPEGDETWTRVEEHLLTHVCADQDRRWKYFSK